MVRVRDYILQSGLGGKTACDSTQLMAIGTLAHEFGHGLGLPDLYDTSGDTEGIGQCVITSYSIHYTKLYDSDEAAHRSRCAGARCEQHAGDDQPVRQEQQWPVRNNFV